MSDDPVGRRRFLGALGTLTVLGAAGCSALPGSEEDPTTVPAATLQAIVDDDTPAIPRTLPVAIEASYLESVAEGVEETLASVPTPLTRADVPNGAIRQDLDHQRDRVTTLLETASEAPSPYEALRTYRRARGDAASVAAAWTAIDEGLTREDVLDRTSDVDAALSDFEGRWAYLGVDPVRSVAVHSALEQRVRSARRIADTDESALEREPENPLTVGKLARDLERGRASVADAAYLYDRHLDASTDPDDLRSTFEGAAESLVADVERRHEALPSGDPSEPSSLVDRNVGDTPAAEVLEDLYWRLESPDYPAEELAAGRPAHATIAATTILARFRAFSAVRERVAGGESYEIDSAEDVRTIRSAAVSALTEARAEITDLHLANADLARLADQLRDVDDRIGHHEDEVRADLLDYEIAEYVQVAAVARALPATIEQVGDELRNSRG